MTLKTDMAEALDDLFTDEEFGEQIIYKGVPIQALVDRGLDPDDKGGAVVDRAVIEVQRANVAAPVYLDPVVFDSKSWRVMRVLSSDFQGHRIELTSNERPKTKRP